MSGVVHESECLYYFSSGLFVEEVGGEDACQSDDSDEDGNPGSNCSRPTGSDMLDMLEMGDLIFMINEKTLMLMRTWHSRDVNEVSRAPDNFDLICCRATKPPR